MTLAFCSIFLMKGVDSMLVAITVAIMSLLINVLFIYKDGKQREDLKSANENIVDLEKEKERIFIEAEKNKDVYSSERKALIAENESYKVKLMSLQRRLKEFNEKKIQYYAELDNLNNFAREMTTEEFLSLREKALDKDSNIHDFTGIYILENKTLDKFYVGQSISLFRRAGSHFTGEGNKDIYEDYSRGDEWTVKLIALSESGFRSINALEKHFIEYHHSTYNGYNKTIGNAN